MLTAVRRFVLRTCWLPFALLIAWLAASRLGSGWGAFAAVWLLVLALISSAALGALGLAVWLAGLRRGDVDPRLALATAAAASVLAWAALTR